MSDDLIIDEEIDSEGSGLPAEVRLKQLRDKLKLAQEAAAENLAGWQRAKADYVNLSKRMRDAEEEIKFNTTRRVVEGVLAVGDSLEAALAGAGADARTGYDALLKQFDAALLGVGVLRVPPTVGQQFDAQLHEPMQTVATDVKEYDNTLAAVMQSGYSLNGKPLRPARVSVYHTA